MEAHVGAADVGAPTLSERLAGAAVQRIDVGPTVALLRIRASGENLYAIVAAGRHGGVGLLAERPWRGVGLPGGTSAEGERARWRSKLTGARVVTLGEAGVALLAGDAVLVVERGRGVTLRELEPAEEPPSWGDERELRGAGERLVGELAGSAFDARRDELRRALEKASARVSRRAAAVRGDLARIREADARAEHTALFVPEAARAARGTTELRAIDWSTGEPREVTLALDPARPAREQVDAIFKRARRLKEGGVIATRRLAEAENALEKLVGLVGRLDGAETGPALEALAGEARRAAPRDFGLAAATIATRGRRADRERPAPAFRTFRGAHAARVLVGKSGERNDELTFGVAKPHDLWLHAKGYAGAHVIVPLDKGASCPADLLVDAAHLAAHFSEARGEGVVEVQHTPRRYLRKPRGATAGLVVFDREKVIAVRLEPARLARLLASEEPGA